MHIEQNAGEIFNSRCEGLSAMYTIEALYEMIPIEKFPGYIYTCRLYVVTVPLTSHQDNIL
jgi:hypothetical protein